jgi:GNAT superfamily N-acetyltransferase
VTIEIVEIEGTTAPDDLLAALARVQNEATAELAGGAPVPSETERVARYRHPSAATLGYWLARVDGEPAGIAYLNGHSPAFVMGDIAVLPRFRRRGVATALFERLRDVARERHVLSFVGHYGNEAGAAFARTIGAEDDQRDVKSVLRLRDADLPDAEPPSGVELLTWLDACPDELVESFVVARSAMNDAPVAGKLALPLMDG